LRSDDEILEEKKRITAQSKDLNEDAKNIQLEAMKLQDFLDDFTSQRNQIFNSLSNINNSESKKISEIQKHYPDTLKIYNFMKQNKSSFNQDVYGPVFTEVSVSNELHALYVEHMLPKWAYSAFVVQNRHDYEIVNNFMIKEKLSNVGISLTDISKQKGQKEIPKAPMPLQDLKKYGITHYWDQIFEAPPAVKEAMISWTSGTTIAVGNDQIKKHQTELIERVDMLKVFLSPTQCFTKKKK